MKKNIICVAAALTLISSVSANAASLPSNAPIYPYGVSQNYVTLNQPYVTSKQTPVYSATPYLGVQHTQIPPVGTSQPIYTSESTSKAAIYNNRLVTKRPTLSGQPEAINQSGIIAANDLRALARLSVQFAEELAPLGVSVAKTTGGQYPEIDDIRRRSVDNNVAFSGDFLIRHNDYLQNSNLSLAGVPGEATTGVLRLRMDAAINDHVWASVRTNLYADTYGSAFGNETNGGTSFRDPITGNNLYKGKNQTDVDLAYIKINDLLEIGRDFYTHGSALVLHDYVDAFHIGHEIDRWKLGLNIIYDMDGNDGFADVHRHVWNFNLDYNTGNHNIYLGYYNQDGQKDPIMVGRFKNRNYVELGSKGTIDHENYWNYDVGFVSAGTEIVGGPSLSGMMYHLGVKYDTHHHWALKLAYTAANDEYVSPMVTDYSQRVYDGPETPFDDIAYINGGKYSPLDYGFTNSNLFKFQAEVAPNEKHHIRLAFDMFNKSENLNGNLPTPKDSAGIFTFEYRWDFYENCRFRTGYQTLDGSDNSEGDKDDRLFMEVFSKF